MYVTFKNFLKIIKIILPQCFKTFLKKYRKFNAINNLDKEILKYLNFKDGFYIECGAYNGVDQSNTWYLERSLNWKGILIEPSKKNFCELIINRSPKNFFENVALVSENYFKNNNKIYLIENNLYSKVNNNNVLNSKEVVATTLNNILKKYNLYKVNFFSLDVEGYEKEVLEGLDLNVFHIDYILIETNYFDQINLILKNHNYILLKKLSIHDYLYKKEY